MRPLTKLSIIYLSIIYILLASQVNSIGIAEADLSASSSNDLANYIPHDPIIINSNDDFITYGFEGNGTSISPYIIANYSITGYAEYGIKICCVSAKYSIQNCYIDIYYDSSTYAIYLQDSPDDCSPVQQRFSQAHSAQTPWLPPRRICPSSSSFPTHQTGVPEWHPCYVPLPRGQNIGITNSLLLSDAHCCNCRRSSGPK